MSLYIDRLPHDAREHFWCMSRPKAALSHTLHDAENALIELAKRLPTMGPTARVDLIINSFGETQAVEAMAVIDAIQSDLDLDAEVAGDPETVVVEAWSPQGGGRCIGDIIEGLDAAIRILAMHGIPTNVPLDGTRKALLSLVDEAAAATDTTPLTRRLHNAVLRSVLRDRRF